MDVTPDAIFTGPIEPAHKLRTRAEMHALAFLARYHVTSTRKGYECALKQWFGFLEQYGIDPLEAKRAHIEIFCRELEMSGRSQATVGGRLNALAGYYKYARIDGLITEDPMVYVQRPTIPRVSTRQGLTRTEFADVLRQAEACTSRDHLLICLLGLNGLRVSEACGINIEDLGRHHGARTVKILRKGGKTQVVPLAPRTQWQLELVVGDRTEGPVLLTRDGHRMDRKTAGQIVKRIVAKAGIRKVITPHSLRHTFVTMSLDAGQSERDIAISAGHADTRLVSYYDRGRENIARNTTHAVAAYVEGAI
jgi:integrase/recombinase XerD